MPARDDRSNSNSLKAGDASGSMRDGSAKLLAPELAQALVADLTNPSLNGEIRDAAEIQLTARLGERAVQMALVDAYLETLPKGSFSHTVISYAASGLRLNGELINMQLELLTSPGVPQSHPGIAQAIERTTQLLEPGIQGLGRTFGYIIDLLRAKEN